METYRVQISVGGYLIVRRIKADNQEAAEEQALNGIAIRVTEDQWIECEIVSTERI